MSIFASPDLKQLLNRSKEGDAAAWGKLVEHFSRLVYSIPRRMGLGEDDSVDIFQATFLALYRNLDRVNDAQSLPKWLSVAASRESLRVKRVNSRTSLLGEESTLDDSSVRRAERGAKRDYRRRKRHGKRSLNPSRGPL